MLSPSRDILRQPGLGGEVRSHLNSLQLALEKDLSHRTSAVDVARCREFFEIVSRAVGGATLSVSDRARVRKLMMWLDTRRDGLQKSLPDLSRAALNVRRSSRWLDIYDGVREAKATGDGIDRERKRPSKQPGYIPPGRNDRVGVLIHLPVDVNERLKALAQARGSSTRRLVEFLIESALDAYQRTADPWQIMQRMVDTEPPASGSGSAATGPR